MALIALIGDCTTTTALAMAAAWPLDREVVVLEVDRRGGSLASWLDTPGTPSLTTIVAARGSRLGAGTGAERNGHGGEALDAGWQDVAGAVQDSRSGVRFLAAPARSREASLAITEAERSLIPMLAGLASPTILADVGRHVGADPPPAVVRLASTVVVVHRQDPASPGAAAVRLERLIELVDQLRAVAGSVVLGVVGDQPFDLSEIVDLVQSNTSTQLALAHEIALDPLSALVLAGRQGVSKKRLARLPLARSIGGLVDELSAAAHAPLPATTPIDDALVANSPARVSDELTTDRGR